MIGDYPRPDRVRDGWWRSLDGDWEWAADGDGDPVWQPARVPAPWESDASGVGRHWVPDARYRRTLDLPAPEPGQELILHFQAVHYRAEILIDGVSRAIHIGGQLPFEVDLSDRAGDRVELTVLVHAPIAKADIPHGKQRSLPADDYDICSFTPCSGIWQTVWLERRPRTHLGDVRLTPAQSLDGFEVKVDVDGPGGRVAGADCAITVEVLDGGEITEAVPGEVTRLELFDPRVWSPEDPHLYQVRVQLWRGDQLLDQLVCTTGLRTVGWADGRLLINGAPRYLRGVLDQGYWPDSGWTAPDAAALEADLRAAAASGFTLVRKHLKLEDPRWLHLADQLGMLVWEEPPSTSLYSADAVVAFAAQLEPMVRRDANHPSIIIWGLYNEEWGLDWKVAEDPERQQTLVDAYDRLRCLDPSRPVIDNSGWSHVRTDLADWHLYSDTVAQWREDLRNLSDGVTVDLGPGGVRCKPLFVGSEPVPAPPRLNSEYGTGRTSLERAWLMQWQTQDLRRQDDLNGYVYCELYDIEHETAGILTSDRSRKDAHGLAPADTHADAVLVLDLDPVAPGTDVISDGGRIGFEARVSWHGRRPLRARLRQAWETAPGLEPTAGDSFPGGDLIVEPFRLSAPVRLDLRMPSRRVVCRLHLWIEDVETGRPVAHRSLDARRAS